nr:Polymyxin resistance protein PmrM [Raoultella sp. NCTC 9187]
MGLIWALLSVGLVSAAQLAAARGDGRAAAAHRPGRVIGPPCPFPGRHLRPGAGAGRLPAVDVCWYFALHRLPLAKAYALLSLSYIVVWAAAIWLPGWHEAFRWRSLLGVLIIVAGVLTIFWPLNAKPDLARRFDLELERRRRAHRQAEVAKLKLADRQP